MSKADLVSAAKAALVAQQDAALQSVMEGLYDSAFAEAPQGSGGISPDQEAADIAQAVSAAVAGLQSQLDAALAQDQSDAAGKALAEGKVAALQSSVDAIQASVDAIKASIAAALNPPQP